MSDERIALADLCDTFAATDAGFATPEFLRTVARLLRESAHQRHELLEHMLPDHPDTFRGTLLDAVKQWHAGFTIPPAPAAPETHEFVPSHVGVDYCLHAFDAQRLCGERRSHPIHRWRR